MYQIPQQDIKVKNNILFLVEISIYDIVILRLGIEVEKVVTVEAFSQYLTFSLLFCFLTYNISVVSSNLIYTYKINKRIKFKMNTFLGRIFKSRALWIYLLRSYSFGSSIFNI